MRLVERLVRYCALMLPGVSPQEDYEPFVGPAEAPKSPSDSYFLSKANFGIANALLEEIVYDETGNILTASLADYLPPTAREIPAIEIHHFETLTPASITKAKGLGEGGAIGAPAAVVNAVNDALSPFGISIDEFPATPQRIRAALRAADVSSNKHGH